MVQYEHGTTSTIVDFFYFYNITVHHNFWNYSFHVIVEGAKYSCYKTYPDGSILSAYWHLLFARDIPANRIYIDGECPPL